MSHGLTIDAWWHAVPLINTRPERTAFMAWLVDGNDSLQRPMNRPTLSGCNKASATTSSGGCEAAAVLQLSHESKFASIAMASAVAQHERRGAATPLGRRAVRSAAVVTSAETSNLIVISADDARVLH